MLAIADEQVLVIHGHIGWRRKGCTRGIDKDTTHAPVAVEGVGTHHIHLMGALMAGRIALCSQRLEASLGLSVRVAEPARQSS